MRNICSFFLVFISPLLCISQENVKKGYIVINDVDTLSGSILFKSNKKEFTGVYFKEKNSDFFNYTPSQIKGYGYKEGYRFSSEMRDGSFAKVLVKGKLSLYQINNTFLIEKDGQLHTLQKQESDEIKNSNWKGILSYLVSDCLNAREITKPKLLDKYLTELVIQYNKCHESKYEEVNSNTKWNTIDVGITSGVSLSNVRFRSASSQLLSEATYYSSLGNFNFGLALEFRFPRSNKPSFGVEVLLSQINFESDVSKTRSLSGLNAPPYSMERMYQFDIKTISIPVYIKNHLFIKKTPLYYNIGFLLNFRSSFDLTRRTKRTILDSEETSIQESFFGSASRQNEIGMLFELGIQKNLLGLRTLMGIRPQISISSQTEIHESQLVHSTYSFRVAVFP